MRLFRATKLVRRFGIRAFSTGNGKDPNWSPVANDQSEAATIDSAKQTIAQAKSESHVYELEDVSKFQSEVMTSSVPIILDCYAKWCEPCKKLTPVLEDMVN